MVVCFSLITSVYNDCLSSFSLAFQIFDASDKYFCPQLADGVFSEKVSCPLGVLLVISESSPDALVQVKSLYSYCGNWNEKYHFDQIRGGFSLLLTSYNFVNRFLH